MSRKLLASIIILLLIIVGAGAYVLYNRETTPPATLTSETMDTAETPSETPKKNTTTGTNQPGRYVTYDAASVASAQGTKLLFFHATWCPQCRALDKDIRGQTLPTGLTIFKVDYDSQQTLRQQYGVTIQTTIVKIDDQGNPVKSYVAYEEPTFAAVKRALLP